MTNSIQHFQISSLETRLFEGVRNVMNELVSQGYSCNCIPFVSLLEQLAASASINKGRTALPVHVFVL